MIIRRSIMSRSQPCSYLLLTYNEVVKENKRRKLMLIYDRWHAKNLDI